MKVAIEAICLVLAITVTAVVGPHPQPVKQATPVASISGLTLYATGQDQTAALQSLYDQAMDGDTIYLKAMNGVKRFVHSKPLNWTGAKSVSVEMTGCELYAAIALSGTQASVTWGGALGAPPISNLHWTGGNVMGALAVQNVSYCKHIDPASAGTLIVQADTNCSYNDFHVGSANGGAGNGSAIIFNHLAPNAWMNCNVFEGMSLTAQLVGGKPSPILWQAVQDAHFPPSAMVFNHCRVEGSNLVLLNVGAGFNAIVRDLYGEGSCVPGTGGSVQSFTVINWPAKWADWLKDPRFIRGEQLQ